MTDLKKYPFSDEYTRLAEIEEKTTIPEADVLKHFGISKEDLEKTEDLEIA